MRDRHPAWTASLAAAALSASLLAALGCGQRSAAGVEVREAYAVRAPGTDSAAVYATISNRRGPADRLVGLKTDAAKMAMLHESVEEGGVVRMVHRKAFDVPADGALELVRGGKHLMLVGLTVGWEAPLELTLEFEKSGSLAIVAPFRSATGVPLDEAGD